MGYVFSVFTFSDGIFPIYRPRKNVGGLKSWHALHVAFINTIDQMPNSTHADSFGFFFPSVYEFTKWTQEWLVAIKFKTQEVLSVKLDF